MTDPVDTLRQAATGRITHRFTGRCPEGGTTTRQRDPDCPVCQALTATAHHTARTTHTKEQNQ